MKILWIVNFSLPAVQRKRGLPVSPSGWWLDTMSKKLASEQEVELTVLSLVQGREAISETIDHISYRVIPISYRDRQIDASGKFISQMHALLRELRPDLIHLQGSEFAIGIPFLKQEEIPVAVSIQGLISEIVKKDYSYPELKFSFSPLDYMMEKIRHFKNQKRGRSEIWQLQHADYIIGRTLWDRTHTYFYNKKARYFYLQECIRDSFLQHRWNVADTEPCTIMCASGLANPLKGFHKIVEAASYLTDEFPALKLKVCGIFRRGEKIGYHHYLARWIRALGMENHVEFLGQLDEQGMCEAFLHSRMYVMGSSVENSPNTLGEAMCLGVPSVVPFVGGVPSLATDEKEVLFYRYDDTQLLSFQMRRILKDDSLAIRLGQNAWARASVQYGTKNLVKDLMRIYQEISKSSNE